MPSVTTADPSVFAANLTDPRGRHHVNLNPTVVGLVLMAAVLHAAWNTFLKVSHERTLVLVLMMGTGSLACLVFIPFVARPADASWPFLFWSVVFHVGYYATLLGAYRWGDLSQVYPIARGTGPLLVVAVSAPLLGESLEPVEMLGVVAACLGVASLAHAPSREHRGRAIGFALATGVFIASYTLADGMGVRASGNPLSYILWMNFLEGLPLLVFVGLRRPRALMEHVRGPGRKALVAGLLAALAYGLVIWAYSLGAIAPIAALRETSVVLAAWAGARLLREPFGRRRTVAAAVVAVGIVLMNV